MIDKILDLLSWQWEMLSDLGVSIITVAGGLAIIGTFLSMSLMIGKENPIQNKGFLKKFLLYVPWALFQQSVILIPFYFVELHPALKWAICVPLFAFVAHLPNWRLVAFTGMFGILFYALWFGVGFQSLVHLSILHGLGGSLYYLLGYDMRVWRFNIKYE